jgi:hypothetical protein
MTTSAASMTRRKHEITARMNERDYPHVVEIALPSGGFRARSDDMQAFHSERGIQIRRGHPQRLTWLIGWHSDRQTPTCTALL